MNSTNVIRYATRPTPVGLAFAAAGGNGLVGFYFVDEGDLSPALDRLGHDFPGVAVESDPAALAEALDLAVAHIDDGTSVAGVELDLRGTPFQLRVWEALREIPRGATTSYGALAERLGLPTTASRAVGTACGANPVSLIVPCHRVLPVGGGLGGYRWGLERKRKLLEIEGARARSLSFGA